MSIKERSAGVWLATMVVTYAAYFTWVATAGETAFWTQIWAFTATVVVQMAVIGIASASAKSLAGLR